MARLDAYRRSALPPSEAPETALSQSDLRRSRRNSLGISDLSSSLKNMGGQLPPFRTHLSARIAAAMECDGNGGCTKAADKIKQELTQRPWYLMYLAKIGLVRLTKTVPDAQDRLFLFHEKGPEFFNSFMELCLFFQAVNTAVYVVIVCNAAFSTWSWTQWVALTFGFCGPVFNVIWLVPNAAQKMVIVTSIESMKDKECCEEVMSMAKKARLVECLSILEMAKMEGKLAKLAGPDGVISDDHIEHYKDKYHKHFSDKRKNDIMKTFAMFDADNSSLIDESELIAVLSSLGFDEHGTIVKSAGQIMKMIDSDGNGSLDEEEFQVLMAMALIKDSEQERKHRNEALFQRFDADGSGEISIEELADAFYKLGVPMTKDSMADLVYQVIHRYCQNLKVEDFVELMDGLEEMSNKD